MAVRSYKHRRPTVGVLAGWQAYAGTLHGFLEHVYRGIQSAAHDRECSLLLSCGVGPAIDLGNFCPGWPVALPDVNFIPVGPWNVDGLIAVAPLLSEARSRYLQQLLARRYPVVFVGAGESGPAVVADNEGGVRQALAHLIEHGHRRVAFIAAGEYEEDAVDDSTYRRRAYGSVVQEYGLEADRDLIVCGYNTVPGGRRAMRQLLKAGTPFTAVLASNDESAIGAMQVLRNAGLLVPQDIAVVGFDDRPEARAQVPPLTTVHHPTFELGYQGLGLLLEYVEGQAEGFKTVRVPTRLVIRESCGCLSGIRRRRVFESSDQRGVGAHLATAGSASRVSAYGELSGGGDGKRVEGITSQIAQAMTEAVSAEMQRLSLDEVDYLCRRLVDAFALSLERNDPMLVRPVMQQILQRVTLLGDDLHAWQAALSILRDGTPALLKTLPRPPARQRVEDMLHQARVAISEMARGQCTRYLLRQAHISDQVSRMTAQFLAARDETRIFEILAENLPSIDMQHAAVALYEPEGDDPVAWSVLQSQHGLSKDHQRFLSRDFPPQGLYSEDNPFCLALLPLFIQDGVSGFVAFDTGNLELCADIVRQLAAALRGVRLYREAVEGRRLAEEANRLKSRFLSMVSHELRTPLNLISGLTDVLLREAEEAGSGKCQVSREDVERIYVSARHLDSLIRDVLDLAQSEAGQLKLVCEPLDLAEVLNAVSLIGEQLARDKGLAWRVDIPQGLPRVWGDRTRLRQVALNLVNNAVKFTARGEIALVVSAEGGKATVSVRDTGLGIPPEEHEAIFDEFRQSERTTARGYGGLGLGLAICKRLLEMQGGKIGVQSSGVEGAGSTFYFSLPAMPHRATLSDTEAALGQARQVLLLVRDAQGGRLLKDHLAQQGFDVAIHQVDETVDWLSWPLLAPPEAVVLDLGLASERGWEVLKIIKGNPATQGIPVLFYRLANDQDSGSMLAMDYLTKPVGTADLAEALMSQGLLGRQGDETVEKKVLIVDDEPGVLEMHARIVERQSPHYQVLRARDGWEALEVIRRERPDLVLLDLMMPGLDGFGVLEAMRDEEMTREIPVIVLTGQVLTREDMARLNRGVATVLAKGVFSVDETLEHMEAALAHRRKLGFEAHRIVLEAMAYIHAHYAEPVSLKDVACHISLSERHLTRCFRREMGITLMNYLSRYRVRQAKALLEAGDKNITNVAMAVGFSDSHYFGRVFRREVGVSPGAYQRGRR